MDAASGGFIAPFQVALLLLLGSGGEKFGGFPPAKIPKNRMARASNFGSDHFFAITYIYIYCIYIYIVTPPARMYGGI